MLVVIGFFSLFFLFSNCSFFHQPVWKYFSASNSIHRNLQKRCFGLGARRSTFEQNESVYWKIDSDTSRSEALLNRSLQEILTADAGVFQASESHISARREAHRRSLRTLPKRSTRRSNRLSASPPARPLAQAKTSRTTANRREQKLV